MNAGVSGVELEVADVNKCVVRDSVWGEFKLWEQTAKWSSRRRPRDTILEDIAGESQTLFSFALPAPLCASCPTDLIGLIKEVSTEKRKAKSEEEVADVELLENSMRSGNRWRSSTYR